MEPENIIKSIPEEDDDYDKICGLVKMRFMRIIPSFKIIDKQVPLSFLSDSLYKLKKESLQNGIVVSMNSNNVKIKDYFLFVKTLFRNQKIEVIDFQRNSDKGMPDFKLIVDRELEFFIEFKSKSDSVRPAQLQWIGDNLDKEVWFLILEEVETSIESEEERYRRFHLENSRKELISQVSRDICFEINNKLSDRKETP